MSEEAKKEEAPKAEEEAPKPEEAPQEEQAAEAPQKPDEAPQEEQAAEAPPAPAEEKAEAPTQTEAPKEPEAPKAESIQGKVKWFSNVKGYGFLQAEGQERDIFVHYSSIQGEGYKTLNENEEVTFEVVESGKGPQAANVVRAKKQADKEGKEAKSE